MILGFSSRCVQISFHSVLGTLVQLFLVVVIKLVQDCYCKMCLVLYYLLIILAYLLKWICISLLLRLIPLMIQEMRGSMG